MEYTRKIDNLKKLGEKLFNNLTVINLETNTIVAAKLLLDEFKHLMTDDFSSKYLNMFATAKSFKAKIQSKIDDKKQMIALQKTYSVLSLLGV